MARYLKGDQVNARPYTAIDEATRQKVHLTVMTHVRGTLQRGPHAILELRAGLTADEAGALPVVLEDMARAGEIASMGHSIYASVPWMPATRPVKASPAEDLVLAGLTEKDAPDELASWLGLSIEVVRTALATLEKDGLVQQCVGRLRRGKYRLVSHQLAANIRRGANNRVFTDIAAHE